MYDTSRLSAQRGGCTLVTHRGCYEVSEGRDPPPNRVYDIFEVLPDGSPRWRGAVEGLENVMPKLNELAGAIKNELFAIDFTTGEVVARIKSLGFEPELAADM